MRLGDDDRAMPSLLLWNFGEQSCDGTWEGRTKLGEKEGRWFGGASTGRKFVCSVNAWEGTQEISSSGVPSDSA